MVVKEGLLMAFDREYEMDDIGRVFDRLPDLETGVMPFSVRY